MAKRVQDIEYPITVEWLREVKAAMGVERGAQAKLAREIGCSPGTLNELLQNGKRSYLVPKISKALGVTMPTMIMSKDTQELLAVLDKMGDKGRRVLKDLQALDRAQLDVTLAMIEQMSKNKDRS
ncbi:MAG: hypothetical protein M3619_00740 [Myxococcota bacterium]|nr:hypothetical protein [Myxococcota bacterium]